jgi:hypothetical protein
MMVLAYGNESALYVSLRAHQVMGTIAARFSLPVGRSSCRWWMENGRVELADPHWVTEVAVLALSRQPCQSEPVAQTIIAASADALFAMVTTIVGG